MRATFDTPLVVLESYAANADFMNVRLNDRKGGYLATRHLIEKGHKRIAFVGPDTTERGVVKERYEGYRQALEEAGFDNLEIATIANPKLTTITQDLDRKAHTAVELLLQSLKAKDQQPQETVLEVELIERESVKDRNGSEL